MIETSASPLTADLLAERVVQRVLVADPEARVADALQAVLARQGVVIERAQTPAVAYSLLQSGSFDVALIDRDFIDRDPRLAAADATHDACGTYVILVGDAEDAATFARQIERGADDFLVRPVTESILAARLSVAARVRARHRRLHETRERLSTAHDKIRAELQAAGRLQQALLPAPNFTLPGFDLGWRLRPCAELAGDLLNCFRLDERHCGFYVLDVSGHGVCSALLSVQVSRLMTPVMSVSQLLKERTGEEPWYQLVEPAEVLRRLNARFQLEEETRQYFTMAYGRIDLKTRELRFAVAGHPGPILLLANGDPEVLSCSSHPVGLFDEPSIEERRLVLNPGDQIWFYSDGLTDVADGGDRLLDSQGLAERIGKWRDAPPRDAVDHVIDEVEAWCHPATPGDDCSLLVFRAV